MHFWFIEYIFQKVLEASAILNGYTPLLVHIEKHVTMLIFSIQPGLAQMSSANGSNNGK